MRFLSPVTLVATLLITALLVGGCAGLLTPKQKPVDLFDVSPGEAAGVIEISESAAGWSLAIEEPLATSGLGGFQIMVRPTPLQLQPLAGARWSERVPAMVQTFLIELFESSGTPTTVGRSGAGAFDFSLESEVRAFEAEFFDNDGPGTVRVRLAARLVSLPHRRIVATHSFESTVRTQGKERIRIVEAFDLALRNAGREVFQWTLATVNDSSIDPPAGPPEKHSQD